MTFDFSCVDWSDDETSPFDQCESSFSDLTCDTVSLSASSSHSSSVCPRTFKIRFAQDDEVFETLHLNNYNNEEHQRCFYRRHEYKQMRSQLQTDAFRMESQSELAVDSDTFTKRGLEYRTQEGGMKRTHHKLQATAAVLEEQHRQWTRGQDDPERIAAAYRVVSSKCLGMAMLQGIQDQNDVRNYLPVSTPPSTPSSTPTPTPTTTTSLPEVDSSTSPCKPYESESCTRLAGLEDIKILAVLSEQELWFASPAAA